MVLVILVAFTAYITFFAQTNCKNYECFQNKMFSCDKASYVNEQTEATWLYIITGSYGDNCNIDVKLVQAKQGELGIDKLRGLSMQCSYLLGTSAYPEKDLSKCHGRLKEELQIIIINKLHSYIVENLGTIKSGLESAV